jgi:predicted permease
VRGLARSLHSNYGFNPRQAVVAESDLHMAGYSDDQIPELQRRMLAAARALPGVTAAGQISEIPLGLGAGDSYVYTDATTDYRPTNNIADAMNYDISPGYLAAAGTRLLAGRDFTWDDSKKAPTVAIVNQKFAKQVFGSAQKALGAHFKFWSGNRAEVVGVVEDGKYRTLTEEQQPAMFFPLLQHGSSDTSLVVRSNRDPDEIELGLERALHGIDSSVPLQIDTWSKEMDAALFAARVATVALGVLGLLGAMLAVTGIFGMASYVVSKRLRELGIRVALGAGKREILSTALGRAFRLLAIGSLAGLGMGLMGTQVLASIVYQATPKDPIVLGGVIIAMLLLGMAAAVIPAHRALAVDPMILLRDE